MSLPEPTKQPDDLATLLNDITLARSEYPNDTVLKLMQRLAVQLQHHTWDSSHVRVIGNITPPASPHGMPRVELGDGSFIGGPPIDKPHHFGLSHGFAEGALPSDTIGESGPW